MNQESSARRGPFCRSVPVAAFVVLSWALPLRAADWTLMVYMNGDSDLEKHAIDDFLEMSAVGSGSGVEIVVQFDRGKTTSDFGGWTTCRRFRVTGGMTPAMSPEENLGEVDMADPAVLKDFIDWAAENYPADRYALVLWGQGDGYRSVFVDTADGTGASELSVREVQQALDDASVEINLIGFNAGLMGMVEVAYELRDAGPVEGANGGPEVVVFSQDVMDPGGWPYRPILLELKAADPPMTAAQLGTAIVDNFREEYSNQEGADPDVIYTISAVKMSEVDAVVADVGSLAAELRGDTWDTDRAAVKSLAEKVLDSIDAAVYSEGHGKKTPGASGLSIYFPSLEANLDWTGYAVMIPDFAANTEWEEFLSLRYYDLDLMIESWVSDARRRSLESREDTFVDLGDFCDRLVKHAIGCYHVDLVAAGSTGVTTGAKNWQGNEWCNQLTLPFKFPFFGVEHSSVYVCANGYLEFVLSRPDPDPDNSMEKLKGRRMIAPFWTDLDTTGGDVYVHEDKDADPPYLCIRWVAKHALYTGGDVEFEVLLYNNGDIRFNYADSYDFFKDHRTGASDVSPPTIGISAGDDKHYEPSFYDFVWDLQTTFSETYTACVPKIVKFTSNPDTTGLPVEAGTEVTLEWETQDMALVSVTDEAGNEVGDGSLIGSAVVTPEVTTKYTLTTVDPFGVTSIPDPLTVRVEGIVLTYPVGGEVILGNHPEEPVKITWDWSEISGNVRIQFWNGADWSDLTATVNVGDGTYDWDSVPNQDLPTCKVRISDPADGSPSDESDAFTVLADTDKDWMPDSWETLFALDPNDGSDAGANADTDELTNLEEYEAGTFPDDEDSDEDGLLDHFEVAHDGLDPLKSDTDLNGTEDGADDHDGDGLTNLEEQTFGTDPNLGDTDGDRLPDDWEAKYFDPDDPTALNPVSEDSDGDGTRDDQEDTDGDGYSDYWEYERGYDPTNALDPPPSGGTESSGECTARTAGSASGFGLWMLALAAGLVVLGRRPAGAQ